ncbi:hypothetical protein KJE20_07485 [Pyrenophora tritici-repentis]|nr:hypothetical protein KJE20_07485 [Pyrenophora tritici-repentis]
MVGMDNCGPSQESSCEKRRIRTLQPRSAAQAIKGLLLLATLSIGGPGKHGLPNFQLTSIITMLLAALLCIPAYPPSHANTYQYRID